MNEGKYFFDEWFNAHDILYFSEWQSLNYVRYVATFFYSCGGESKQFLIRKSRQELKLKKIGVEI